MTNGRLYAQLHQSGQGEVLLALASLTAEDPGRLVPDSSLVAATDRDRREVRFFLDKLRNNELVEQTTRASGGWRLTPDGVRVAGGLKHSLEHGILRLNYAMRMILGSLKGPHDGTAERTDWIDWDLHEDGYRQVTLEEREQALDVLKETNYITSNSTSHKPHLRINITNRGRLIWEREDILLDGLLDMKEPEPQIHQRIGIQAQTFHNNGGAVQTGDNAIQNTTITNTQVERINEGIAASRAVIARENLNETVRVEISEALDELEAAAAQQPEKGVLHGLLTKATMAAAGTAGSAAGGAIFQSLATIGSAIV